jgi:catechol 2,3-dioxygenase-like lactoylglutathione lyase family enzyme
VTPLQAVTQRPLGLVLLATLAFLAADKKPVPDPRAPIRLEEIHYYLTNPGSAILFLESHFEAHELPQVFNPPLRHVTSLGLEPGEGSFEISPPGPFEGLDDAEQSRWHQSREMMAPAINLPARYGVYWVGIRTTSLKKAMQKIESRGVTVQEHRLVVPIDPRAKAASIYGPDLNVFALVERPHRHGDSGEFGLDHVQLLVKNVAENVSFFEDVFAAQVQGKSEHQAFLTVGGFPIAISDPEGLDLIRADVQERSPTTFRFEADHISFLFSDIHPAVEAAKAKGRKFAREPKRLEYFGKPTPYTFAVINSPDGLPFQLGMFDNK